MAEKPPGPPLQQHSEPSIEGFLRIARANRLWKGIAATLAFVATASSVASVWQSAVLREFTRGEQERAIARFADPIYHASLEKTVRQILSDTLAEAGYAPAAEVVAVRGEIVQLREDLRQTNSSLQETQAAVNRLLGRLEAQPSNRTGG